MAKRYKVVDPLRSGTSQQAHLTDTLGAGYKTITDLLTSFSRIGCLPKTLDLSRLDDGDMELRLHFSNTKLSGMMHVDFDIIKLNYNVQRRERDPQKM